MTPQLIVINRINEIFQNLLEYVPPYQSISRSS